MIFACNGRVLNQSMVVYNILAFVCCFRKLDDDPKKFKLMKIGITKIDFRLL